MRAGLLRHRLTILNPTDVSSSWNSTETTWTTYATVWGSIEPISGREYYEAEQVQSQVRHMIIIRFIHGVTPNMRISFEGRTFKIIAAINPIERGRKLEITATEATD